MNIIFFGTPEFAKTFLEALHADQSISISAVVCQPDKPVGRHHELTPPPTKGFALENDLRVLQPAKKSEILDALKPIGPVDLFVIVAYGNIIPQEVLDLPKHGCINVHPSLLPKYRGPSPIQAAIANQDTETGVSIMLIDDQMDHGPLLAQVPLPIEAKDDSETLLHKAGVVGAPLLVDVMKKYLNGATEPKPQDHARATFCKLIKKEDGVIDWSLPAEAIDAQIRAYRPWPGTFTTLDGKVLKIHIASPLLHEEGLGEVVLAPGEIRVLDKRLFVGTGSVPLELFQVQLEGRGRIFVANFLNGHPNLDGRKLT